MIKIAKNWYELLKPEFESPYYKNLEKFLKAEYSQSAVYPAAENIFAALNFVPFEKVKVVIIGQDPYHQFRQANGLCFSVPDEVEVPPSLVNIYKEIQSDLGYDIPKTGNLYAWAKQGVLLLNSVLTVRANQPNSHKARGWEQLTAAIIKHLNNGKKPVVFLLWGRNAKEIGKDIDTSRHLVLTAPHPSPLSAYSGFFGCKHFSKANEFLLKTGQEPINWKI